MGTHQPSVYVSESEPRTLVARSERAAVHEVAAVVAARGYALVAPRPPLRPGAAPRVLTPAEIHSYRPLRLMAARLPPELRLVVVGWPDGAAVVTAVPIDAEPPNAKWLAAAYAATKALPDRAPPPEWWPLRAKT